MTNRSVLPNSVQTLRVVYMVVAGLALAYGLEKFVFDDNEVFQFPPNSQLLWLFFIVFASTVWRFVHGAMRHFDVYYVEQPEKRQWIAQPLWDFLFLGAEAFVFFLLAFSLDSESQFINYFLWLLVIDTLWLVGVFVTHITRIWNDTAKRWIIANFVVLPTTGIPFWGWYSGAGQLPEWLLWVFFLGVLAHAVMDYVWNWRFYFGESPQSSTNKESLTSASGTTNLRQQSVDIVFVAGAYTGADYNEIDENIRLAEKYSIELWNRGYKVFCPHLNTSHFEVKTRIDEQAYKDFDVRILGCCDVVFALPNWETSAGAKFEIEEARKLGKPVLFSLDDLPIKG